VANSIPETQGVEFCFAKLQGNLQSKLPGIPAAGGRNLVPGTRRSLNNNKTLRIFNRKVEKVEEVFALRSFL
jgi:hypothetical protein